MRAARNRRGRFNMRFSMPLLMVFAAAASAQAPVHRSYNGTILDLDSTRGGLRLALPAGETAAIAVRDQGLLDGLKNWNPGDKVVVGVSVVEGNGSETVVLESIDAQTVPVSPMEPTIAMFVSALALLAFTALVSRDVRGLLFLGEDGRYSNSKSQISLWFGVVICAYLSAFWMRWWHAGFVGHIAIPQNLLLISGASGLTFAGAKGITCKKVADAKAAGFAQPKGRVPSSFPGDLLRDDNGDFDLGDYQMIVITLISLLSYVLITLHFLSRLEQRVAIGLPDVDSTMLGLFGVGQGAYLTKKAVTGIDQ